MYQYIWDAETGGLLLTSGQSKLSKEPRPVYYKELDILGFDQYWNYPRDDSAPLLWAEANNYIYKGRTVARTKGGSLYTKPEIILMEEPEPDGVPLQFVDVKSMCQKNHSLMEALVQETIQEIYNTYRQYRKRIDVFYVAFSGGKDSIVTLDLVQRALPHDSFKVLFGDTQMEFSDTYDVIARAKADCEQNGIEFLIAKSHFKPEYAWNKIGPPAQRMRWCCGVLKTAPQILLLRDYTKNPEFKGMAIQGIRAEESNSRSQYKVINFGVKHRGQFDFYPILQWSSAEVYIYIYCNNLILNETYKKGNGRAGCLVCPMEASKNSWIKNQLYSGSITDSRTTTFYYNIILEKTMAHDYDENDKKIFLDVGAWRTRHNGSKLYKAENLYKEKKEGNAFIFSAKKLSNDWSQWFKTVGELIAENDSKYILICDKKKYYIELVKSEEGYQISFKGFDNSQNDRCLLSWIKQMMKRATYCASCKICEVNCPYGYISMEDGHIYIDDKCTKCKLCYKVSDGCVIASSQNLPKEGKQMNGSIDQYKNLGIRYEWITEFFSHPESFWNDNGLGSMMITLLKVFLRHSQTVTSQYQLNDFGIIVKNLGIETPTAWGLMLCNLVYSPQFSWWTFNIEFDKIYTQSDLRMLLQDFSLTSNQIKNVVSGFKIIFDTNPILSNEIGYGKVNVERKGKSTTLIEASRTPWLTPIPVVILYSLYKFAEACGDYYQFSLETLLDDSIDRDGVSPTRIFGLDRDTMVRILNGLSINYPDFISASFTLDLDNITLRDDKTANDVLQLL